MLQSTGKIAANGGLSLLEVEKTSWGSLVAQKNGAGHVLYEMPGEVSCIPWPSNIQTLIHLFHQRPRTDHGPHGKLN